MTDVVSEPKDAHAEHPVLTFTPEGELVTLEALVHWEQQDLLRHESEIKEFNKKNEKDRKLPVEPRGILGMMALRDAYSASQSDIQLRTRYVQQNDEVFLLALAGYESAGLIVRADSGDPSLRKWEIIYKLTETGQEATHDYSEAIKIAKGGMARARSIRKLGRLTRSKAQT